MGEIMMLICIGTFDKISLALVLHFFYFVIRILGI